MPIPNAVTSYLSNLSVWANVALPTAQEYPNHYEFSVSNNSGTITIPGNPTSAITVPIMNGTVNQCITGTITGGTANHVQSIDYIESLEMIRNIEAAAEHHRRNLEATARYEKEKKEKAEAESRARSLLIDALTAPQLERFLKDECIPIDTKAGNKYLIKKGRVANINVLNADGSIKHRLCAHPAVEVPDYDTMLAQMLHLKYSEEDFLKIANMHRLE